MKIKIILIVGITIVLGGWYFVSKNNSIQNVSSITESNTETDNWKIYKNTAHNFKLNYPESLTITTVGPSKGEVDATGDESLLSIGIKNGNQTMSFIINPLGSKELGSYYASAKNIVDFLDLISKTDDSGKVVRRFIGKDTIDGETAYIYEIYRGSPNDQAVKGWSQQIFFQHREDIYEVDIYRKESEGNKILSTFKFIK
ncbi:MAG: hypothetical protein JWN89_30 [Parcubacteria group bacterium]|nr:hypothetical protein [Parcubacteria group bacterium]